MSDDISWLTVRANCSLSIPEYPWIRTTWSQNLDGATAQKSRKQLATQKKQHKTKEVITCGSMVHIDIVYDSHGIHCMVYMIHWYGYGIQNRTSMYVMININAMVSMYMCNCMYACMYACMHECMSVCLFVCLCVCLYVCLSVCVYACLPACLPACMHACMHAWMYACMHGCMYVCMYVCMSARVHMCACARLQVCMSACLHVFMCACVHVCTHSYIHACS